MQLRMNLYRRVLDRVQSLPGVVSAGFTTGVPLAFKGWRNAVQAEGMPESAPGESPMVNFRVVTPDYRETLGIPLLRGRDIEESDGPDAPPVALVNEAMARMLWPGQDPLGKRFRHGGWPLEDYPWITVVGLVADIKQNGLDVPARPEMYLSYQQSGNTPRVLAVRTRQDPVDLTEAIRREILSVDPDQPISDVATMETILDRETFQRHLQAILLAAFAGLAVLVAAFGVYGVISYMVEQNRHEFGVRMALGARPAQVLSNVIGSGLRMTAGGVVLGLIAALGFTRLLSHVLFGIGPWDVPTYAGVSIVLMAAAVLATLIPAVRATRVDPLAALREE
jgi:putative ABC transport system permease protein